MNKDLLEKLYLHDKKSQRDIAKELCLSQTTVRYYLKKFSIVKREEHQESSLDNLLRKCPRCNVSKNSEDFYKCKKGNRIVLSSYCRSCNTNLTVSKLRREKQKCLDYLGGTCMSCGFNKYAGALEFHHLDPSKKDYEISKRYRKFDDNVRLELDKCVLLCSNCHKMAHAGLIDCNTLSKKE